MRERLPVVSTALRIYYSHQGRTARDRHTPYSRHINCSFADSLQIAFGSSLLAQEECGTRTRAQGDAIITRSRRSVYTFTRKHGCLPSGFPYSNYGGEYSLIAAPLRRRGCPQGRDGAELRHFERCTAYPTLGMVRRGNPWYTCINTSIHTAAGTR